MVFKNLRTVSFVVTWLLVGFCPVLAQSPDLTGTPVVPVSSVEARLYTLARDTMVRTLLCAEGFDNNDDADPAVTARLEKCYRQVMDKNVRFIFASGDEAVGVESIIAFFRDVRGPQITRSSVRGDTFRLLSVRLREDPRPGEFKALTGTIRISFKGTHEATALTDFPLAVPGPYPMDFHFIGTADVTLKCRHGRCKQTDVHLVDSIPFEPRN